MKKITRLQSLVNIGLVISMSLICLHLLNKEKRWFNPQYFCLRTIYGVFVFSFFLLAVSIIVWWLED